MQSKNVAVAALGRAPHGLYGVTRIDIVPAEPVLGPGKSDQILALVRMRVTCFPGLGLCLARALFMTMMVTPLTPLTPSTPIGAINSMNPINVINAINSINFINAINPITQFFLTF